MIEEGCCVLFSLVAPPFSTPGYGDAALQLLVNSPEEAHYAEALFAAKELSAFAPDAVRLLRAIEPHWDRITPEMIQECPSSDDLGQSAKFRSGGSGPSGVRG